MIWKGILIGGVGLSAGATVIEKLPASAVSADVSSGLAEVGTFFPLAGTIGGASLTLKQLNKLRRLK